jgi:hypothetical protein
MSKIVFTRKEFYDLVWSQPFPLITKKYLVSDGRLRKTCKDMMVPIPNSGHWARLPVNRVAPLKLSTRYYGDDKIELQLRGKKDDSENIAIKEREEEFRDSHIIRIFERLIEPDELIIASQKILNEKDGRSFRYRGMLSSERTALDICVLPENVTRALCFMDSIIKTLKERGHDVRIRQNETYAVVFDEEIKMTFRDKLKRVIVKTEPYTETELVSTGEVCFKVRIRYNDKEWKDGKESLEQQLPMIMARIELEGQRRADERIYYRKQREKQERKEKREKALREKTEKELKHFNDMLDQAVRWRKAKDLRAYIDEREKNAIAKDQMTGPFKRWLIWARKKADWYDPFVDAKDKLLKHVEKDKTKSEKSSPIFENENFFEPNHWRSKSFYHR